MVYSSSPFFTWHKGLFSYSFTLFIEKPIAVQLRLVPVLGLFWGLEIMVWDHS